MTIAYPLKSQKDYTELLYSLRSIEKHITPPYEIVIIGDTLPDWITNVTWINIPEIKTSKHLSVKRKILAALSQGEDIFYMNDDIYLLQDTDMNFPYYFNGDLKSNSYTGSKQLQLDLKAMGKPTKCFELHYPMVFKSDFTQIIQNFHPDTMIRSAYCNYLGIEGEQLGDCKFINSPKKDQLDKKLSLPCISTGAHSLPGVLPVLREMFPMKSKFEI